MANSEEPVMTGIDALVRYINEHGETDETTLAKEFRVSAEVIETWASALEKAKMVRVTYKMGRMFISPIKS